MRKVWIVAYDICEPKRLQKVAKKMLGYGSRIQYSVFLCELSDLEKERMNWEIGLILQDGDKFLIAEFCKNCGEKLYNLLKIKKMKKVMIF